MRFNGVAIATTTIFCLTPAVSLAQSWQEWVKQNPTYDRGLSVDSRPVVPTLPETTGGQTLTIQPEARVVSPGTEPPPGFIFNPFNPTRQLVVQPLGDGRALIFDPLNNPAQPFLLQPIGGGRALLFNPFNPGQPIPF